MAYMKDKARRRLDFLDGASEPQTAVATLVLILSTPHPIVGKQAGPQPTEYSRCLVP